MNLDLVLSKHTVANKSKADKAWSTFGLDLTSSLKSRPKKKKSNQKQTLPNNEIDLSRKHSDCPVYRSDIKATDVILFGPTQCGDGEKLEIIWYATNPDN
jgi:hypothetical protein